jgi:CubicO group peptidase (beta-lactamase class C family)
MAAKSLPRSAPASQGADSRGIAAFIDAVEAAPDIDLHSLMVLRHGQLIAQGWWAPYTPDRKHHLYSLSKIFTSTAVAFAVAEGLLRLDDPLVSYFPEFDAEITDPGSRSILVRHAASMASGHLGEQLDAAVARDGVEPVRGFLLGPPEREPGTVFAYNQPCTYTLAAIVQRMSGQTLTQYLRPRLFDPLGIGEVAWQQRPDGRDIGFAGLHATTDAIARLGLLYLQRGVWEGRRLLSEEWVGEATRSHIGTVGDGFETEWPDWEQGYGFQFWMSRHGYRGDGAYGQFCLVLPEQDAVIAITSETHDMQGVLDLVWEHLLPAFDDGPAGAGVAQDAVVVEGTDAALERRLAGLALPLVPAAPTAFAEEGAWDGAVFTRSEKSGEPHLLSGVRLTAIPSGWELELVLDEDVDRKARAGGQRRDGRTGSLPVLRLVAGRWSTSNEQDRDAGEKAPARDAPAPAAVGGGWTDADTLRFDVLFLETPHRLTVTCSLVNRSFDARWQTTPFLSDLLRGLQAPLPG